MSHVIRIPDDLYIELGHRANAFDTPADVIWSLLALSGGAPNKSGKPYKPQAVPARSRRNPTTAEWKEHIEIVMGYRKGETTIGTPSWTMAIHDSFCKGEAAFGATSTTAAEAMLQVIKEHTPNKYPAALQGLRATILDARAKGGKLRKVAKMYERVSGEPLDSRT
ncbi:MAG: hypothetical protein BMS9Abin25_0564 [Gammaproteobacteria bacterium]|nr:MAG: hypothetical protein BMS9Abin25_0564 [Gammaproteobacteria bacterium]